MTLMVPKTSTTLLLDAPLLVAQNNGDRQHEINNYEN